MYKNDNAAGSIAEVILFPVGALILLMLFALIDSCIPKSSNLSVLNSVIQSVGSALLKLFK